MTQCCYKTPREDSRTLQKIDAVLTAQLLRHLLPVFQCYAGYAFEYIYSLHMCIFQCHYVSDIDLISSFTRR